MSSFLFISTTSIHPIIAFEHLNLYIQKQLDAVTINSKLEQYQLFSENTFAGHWETVADCMENIEQR